MLASSIMLLQKSTKKIFSDKRLRLPSSPSSRAPCVNVYNVLSLAFDTARCTKHCMEGEDLAAGTKSNSLQRSTVVVLAIGFVEIICSIAADCVTVEFFVT